MRKSRRIVTGLMALAVAGAAACDRSPVDPPGHALLGTVEILDRSTTPHTVLATWTHPAGWDTGVLTTMSHAAEGHRTRVSLGARMLTRGGDAIVLTQDGEFSVRYGVASDPGNVINMDESLGLFHGDHVHIYGFNAEGRTGTAQLVFALWHDGHSDGETDPIGITVTD
jgi:hypothetical protein